MNKPQFESLNQMAEATAGGLSQACAHSAFELFQNASFRTLSPSLWHKNQRDKRLLPEYLFLFVDQEIH